MSTNDPTQGIDLAAIEAEVAKLSPEDLKKQVLAVRTQQKIQQKKSQSNPNHKLYQKKQQEKKKALLEAAKKAGFWDEINDQAEEAAKARFAELQAKEDEENVPETAE